MINTINIFKKFADNVWVHDFELSRTTNTNLESFLGYTTDEIGSGIAFWREKMIGEKAKIELSEIDIEYRIGARDNHKLTYFIYHKDGTKIKILDYGQVFERFPNGKPKSIIGFHLICKK